MESWPSENDFGWGFQANLSSGTRSRTRRVVHASCSSSFTIASTIAMIPPLFFMKQQRHLLLTGGHNFSSSWASKDRAAVPAKSGKIFRELIQAARPTLIVLVAD